MSEETVRMGNSFLFFRAIIHSDNRPEYFYARR